MSDIQLMVNGGIVRQTIEPRMHLADLLRERLNLTGTHLRCEQGVCGACTLLIDGEPARSCITYTACCDGAEVTTIEGLEHDPIIASLREAFTQEHGLQCGFCTPGMLVTARDIVRRLPDANEARIRLELSGNLCRCTGYVGIVRAIKRVLKQGASSQPAPAGRHARRGPVGARPVRDNEQKTALPLSPPRQQESVHMAGSEALGLGQRKPNIEISQSFSLASPPEKVWAFFQDIGRIVSCLPGASVTQVHPDGRINGKFSAKLGPISATFFGVARMETDDATRKGIVRGAGQDQRGGSRAAGELEYNVAPAGEGSQITIALRALLTGPLAQFGRSGIVDDLVTRVTQTFAGNLEARLSGAVPDPPQSAVPLQAGDLLLQVIRMRLQNMMKKLAVIFKPK